MSGDDINAILARYDFTFVMKLVNGTQSLQETETIVKQLGKVLINIGDGLTLLHQAASHNRADLVKYFISQGHPLEVSYICH